MDAKDQGEQNITSKNEICSLEWIAWAIEAARRHKDAEHLESAPVPRPVEFGQQVDQ